MVLCGVFRVSASQEEQQSTRINEASHGALAALAYLALATVTWSSFIALVVSHARAPTRTTRLLAK